MMKSNKLISGFLGVSMFVFGVLKFVNPFKSWYTVQIASSGLGSLSYVLGIAGEIVVGLVLVWSVYNHSKVPFARLRWIVLGASLIVMGMMGTGIFVHLHANVPAEVLPLKIKPPYIPGVFFLLGLSNILLLVNTAKRESQT